VTDVPESPPPDPAAGGAADGADHWLSNLIDAGMAVADGTDPDWASIESAARQPSEHAMLRELRQLAEIARHCRAARDEAKLPTEDTFRDLGLATSAKEVPRHPQFTPGMLVGNRYRLQSLLGQGGMGEVYEAWDEELSIRVALKTLHLESHSDRPALDDLKREAMLARAVVHPNICRVYDLGRHGESESEVYFLTMEALRGETLAERLRTRGRMTTAEAWPLVEQMAAGLQAAHQAGVLHLDFKSSNVILAGDPGRELAVITDFGLARTVEPTIGVADERREPGPKPRSIAGTPAYMAPEQVRGEAAGPAADIYALGVVLYEMVTGKLPFAGRTPIDVAQRRLDEDAPSPRMTVPDLDERWNAVVRRCLEREPERRYASAAEVPAALAGRIAVLPPARENTFSGRHALPPELDSFVGREIELDVLASMIAGGSRLVTLLGAGGMGKTRLAVHYGWQSRASWPGGTWFCDLTEARDQDGIVSAVAKTLGAPLGRGDPVEHLGQVLAARGRCLVILDNLEPVAGPAAAAVTQWRALAPELHLILTSRERLGIAEERILDLDPLRTPAAIQLFLERAQRLRPGLAFGDGDLAAVKQVIKLVDGIPLAIELAAARLRVMSAQQLVAGMHKRFSLLTGGRNARHETLAGVIDGSWALLHPWERAALAQCAVFEGGLTVAAAEAVLDLRAYENAPPVLGVLQSLLDRSMLHTFVSHGSRPDKRRDPRLGMYGSIQEYARRKLSTGGDVPHGVSGPAAVLAAETRHGEWYRRFGTEEALAALDRDGGEELRRALENELENLVAACRRAGERRDGATAAATYVAACAVISMRGPAAAAVALGRDLLATGLPPKERAVVLMTLGEVQKDAGQAQNALSSLEEALALHRELGNRSLEGAVLANLGSWHHTQGRMEDARGQLRAAAAIHREVGDQLRESVDLATLGNIDRSQGRMVEARAYYERALILRRAVGDRRGAGILLGNLAGIDYKDGHVERARAGFEEALSIHRKMGNRRFEASIHANLGNLCRDQGRLEEARDHFAAALAMTQELGTRRDEGNAHLNLGILYQDQGSKDEARSHYEAALAAFREVGDRRWEGVVLGNLGGLEVLEGHLEQAHCHYEAALAMNRESGDRSSEAITLGGLAVLHRRQGRMAEAREILLQGESLLRQGSDLVELAKILCIRVELEQECGNSELAHRLLAEAEQLGARIGAGPASELSRMLAEMRAALSN
jgi:predicted ATPase/tetratricopeptide (TPR) repeat protein